MKLEKDFKFLRLRVFLLFLSSWCISILLFRFFQHKFLLHEFSNTVVLLSSTLITLLLLFLCSHSISIINKTVIFRNIYGIVISRIEMDKIKTFKVSNTSPHHSTEPFFSIFGIKNIPLVKLSLKYGGKRYINGLIISKKSFDVLVRNGFKIR